MASTMDAQMAEATTTEPPATITSWEDMRTGFLNKKYIKQLKVAGTDESAYYVALSPVEFRHGGSVSRTVAPDQVFLLRPPVNMAGKAISDTTKLDSIVAVYYSSSGTGKTVDLAGASYIRSTQLSFFIRVDDGVLSEEKFKSSSLRNESAMDSLENQILALLKGRVRGIEDVLAGVLSGEVARLSVCLDEASDCPIIVRSIISDISSAERAVQSAIWKAAKQLGNEQEGLEAASDRLKILFSVGGTGASGGSDGSIQDNYEHLKTSASLQPNMMYDALLAEMDDGLRRNYSYDAITANTLLKVLVDGNARMTSILLKIILKRKDDDLDSRGLLEETLETFRECNGLKRLEDQERKCKAAAQAIAVHLFQKKYTVPKDWKEQANALVEMDYHGVNFKASIGPYPSRTLVATFGLLEPQPFPGGGVDIDTPFRLPPAMQLMALFLMGLSNISPLEPTSFGFEVLSTQMIKSAIAAALTVSFSERPHLGEILGNQLKFQLPDDLATDEVKAWWAKLSTLKPVQTKLSRDDFRKTRMHRARAAIKLKLVPKEDEKEEYKVARYVFFDEELGNELISLSEENRSTEDGFYPPLCSISIGNSDLVDGYVTFFVTSSEGINSSGIKLNDWTEEQVAGWLEEIGMPQYKENFKKVPGMFLPKLDEATLLKLGIDKKDTRVIVDALNEVKEEKEPRGEKMTVCNQAKDYNNSDLKDTDLNKQAMKVGYACLKKMLGDRLYCVASNKKAWERDVKKSEVHRSYLAFDVSDSRLLGNGDIDMSDLRNPVLQDLQYGKHYKSDLDLVDFPSITVADYLAELSKAGLKNLEEESKKDDQVLYRKVRAFRVLQEQQKKQSNKQGGKRKPSDGSRSSKRRPG